MRLFEIENPTHIEVSEAFKEKLEAVLKSGREIKSKLKDFMKAKLNGQPLSREKFLADPLQKYSRYPLHHGKRLMISRRVGNAIRLYDIIEHGEYEYGGRSQQLKNRLDSIDDFVKFDVDSLDEPARAPQDAIDAEQTKNTTLGLIYQLAQDGGMDILDNAVNHSDWEELLEWLSMEMSNITLPQLFASYGGESQFNQSVNEIMQTVKKAMQST